MIQKYKFGWVVVGLFMGWTGVFVPVTGLATRQAAT